MNAIQRSIACLGMMSVFGSITLPISAQTPLVLISQISAEDLVQRGLERDLSGDLQGAIADYSEAIRLDPTLAVAYSNRGAVLTDLADYQNAIVDLDEAIRLDPNFAGAYSTRGNARFLSGDVPGGFADWDKAIQLNPSLAIAYVNRGNGHFLSGDIPKALADYDEAIRLDPNSILAYTNRATVRLQSGDFEGAIADYNELHRLDPARYPTNFIFLNAEEVPWQEMIASYDESIRQNPDNANAYLMRGLARIASGDIPGGKDDLERAADLLNPDSADAYFARGLVRLVSGDIPEGKADLERAADLFQQQGNTEKWQQVMNWLESL